jgi:adenine-specific DNA-methyltransferase
VGDPPSFVQISDENLHHVRELMDEVFGADNSVAVVDFVKTSGLAAADALATACDYLLWYGKDRTQIKYRQLFAGRNQNGGSETPYSWVDLPGGERRAMSKDEREGTIPLPISAKVFRIDNLTKPGPGSRYAFDFEGRKYEPGKRWWGTTPEGMKQLAANRRLIAAGNGLYYVRYANDFPAQPLRTLWADTGTGGFVEEKYYVVQTNSKVISRCVAMTTDPGDLVLDPTCGSGTTAYCAEQWGRRWITCDTSRVPMALARQRLLTATFDWYELKDESRGPTSGFVYKRRQNNKGEEVGGIVPHVTLKSIANDEPPDEEVLVDRPEIQNGVTRVTGPFCVEATIPTPNDFLEAPEQASAAAGPDVHGSFVDRMLEILRKSPVLRLEGNKTVTLKNVRPPAKTLSLSAEAVVVGGNGNGKSLTEAVQEAAEASGHALPFSQKAVALVFGPENGAVSEKLVYEAAKEANAKNYAHLYVIGFAIQPNARLLRAMRQRSRHSGDLRPNDHRCNDGRPAQEHAVKPDIQRLWSSRSPSSQGEEDKWHSAIRSRVAGPRCFRSS